MGMIHFHSRELIKSLSLLGNLQSFIKASKYVVCLWASVIYAGMSGVMRCGPTVQKPLGRGSGRFFLGNLAWTAPVGGSDDTAM